MSTLDEVRDRLDIVDVVGDYVELKRAGRSHKGLCPFHDERTPSFVVSPERGTWRCFGACGVGGDAFDFVMRVENVGFREALERLAERVGVQLEPPSPQAQERKERSDHLRTAVTAAADYFHARLTRHEEGAPARDYLKARGFGLDDAKAFLLGWAPDDWSRAGDALRAMGFTDDDLLEAGLVRERESGGVYDAFRGRLVFPIRDARGRPIGFGARTLDPEGIPKYINSPQTALFDKSGVLFGLDRARRAIRSAGLAVVVEGYTDVMRAHQAGFANVVASLGTAVTDGQVALLRRDAEAIVLALDADAAGQAATLRGLEVAQRATEGALSPTTTGRGLIRYVRAADVELRVARLPEGRDPDDVIRDDPEAWRHLVEGAKPVMAYLFDTLLDGLDLEDPTGKTAAVERMAPVIAELGDPVARAAWVAHLAARVRLDDRTVSARLARLERGRRKRPARAPEPPPAFDGAPLVEGAPPEGDLDAAPARPAAAPRDRASYVLGHLLAVPERLTRLNAALKAGGLLPLGADDFERHVDRDLLAAVGHAALGAPPPDAPAEHRLDRLPEAHAAYAEQLRARAAGEPAVDEPTREKALFGAIVRLRNDALHRALTELSAFQREAAPGARAELDRRIDRLRARLDALHRLLSPLGVREEGPVDRAARR